MNEQLKTLLKKLKLSEETATEIRVILEAAMDDAKEEGKEAAMAKSKEDMVDAKASGKKEAEDQAKCEKDELKESHDAEIAFLKEKAEEYGTYLLEKGNDYGAFLMEKANDYGDMLKGKANRYGEHIKESVTEKMKEYADYAVENFITENRDRFIETEEYARMKSAFGYIREAFEKNAFDVREDTAVAELTESLAESTRLYESLFEDLALTKESLETAQKDAMLKEATDGLADTQKEKVKELVEAVSFDTLDDYKEGVAMLVEQVKVAPRTVTKLDMLIESQQGGSTNNAEKKVDSSVAAYMQRPGLF